MGVEYSAGVFYGAKFHHGSKHGKLLCKEVDALGGTPAPANISGVVIREIGDRCSFEADWWYTVEIKEAHANYGKNMGICPPPILLREDPAWRDMISDALTSLCLPIPDDIGWHFFGSVS